MPKFKSREEYEEWKASLSRERESASDQSEPWKKPVLIRLIGWAFIVLSVFMISGGISGLASSALLNEIEFDITSLKEETYNMPELFHVFLFILKYSIELSFLFILIAFFVLISGIFFLQLKGWARTALEVFSWAAAAVVVAGVTLWVSAWMDAPDAPSAAASMFGAMIGVIVLAFYASVPVTALIVLRRRSVKDFFTY
jgi:hypothetical protein